MAFEYTHLVETFTLDVTLKKVNKLAKEGWRFMFIQGPVYWFERPVGTGTGTEVKTETKNKKSAAAGKK